MNDILQEWKRVLKPRGILRIAVPDFKNIVELYSTGHDIEKFIGPIYGKWKINNKKTVYHKTIYDNKSLTNILEKNNFVNIKEWDWK